MRGSFALALCLTFALMAPIRSAHAEAAPTIAEVEGAYAEVDFERTRSLAREVLALGKSEPTETLGLYTLLGISAAALGEEDTARRAFRVAIALDPNARIEKNLSPKIRGPYLEARGSLGTQGELRALAAEIWRDGKRVRFALHDPANVVRRAELGYIDGFGTWQQVKLPPQREGVVPGNATKAALEYALVLRDEFGNVLFRRGSETTPATLAAAAAAAAAASTPSRSSDPFAAPVTGERVNQTPYHVVAGVLAASGLAAAGLGAYFHVQREELAREWNGASCERGGASRKAQCAEVDDRRARAQTLGIGLYTTGGALLVGSVVTLLLTPSHARARRAAVTCDLAALTAGCIARF
jgi:hypothetical protein